MSIAEDQAEIFRAVTELKALMRPDRHVAQAGSARAPSLSPAVTGCARESLENARLIAAMRNLLPRLLAALENTNAIASAWAQDRSEQYTDNSSAKVALENLAHSFHKGEHLERFERGEFDDLLPRPYR